ncbi:MAG TPA: hypothetical protein VIY56_07720 [Vicinamibacterales bacterium]
MSSRAGRRHDRTDRSGEERWKLPRGGDDHRTHMQGAPCPTGHKACEDESDSQHQHHAHFSMPPGEVNVGSCKGCAVDVVGKDR